MAKKSFNVWIAEHLGAACLGLFALLVLVAHVALFAPEMRRIRAANRLDVLRQEYEQKQAYQSQLTDLEKKFADVPKEDVERLLAMIPDRQDIPGLLATLEASANASALTLSAINFARGDKPPHLAALPNIESVTIALTLEHGTYQRFKLFLESLEQNLRLFDVASVNLNPSAAQYTLILRAYVRTAT
jgi:Tfp pilus assembly protein PilO